jgi:hypothetical protein
MLHDKQKVICHTLIIVVAFTIVMLGSYYSTSFVSAFSLQPTIHHHNKVFDKKQESDSSSSSDTKRSDNSDNNGNSNNNNNDDNNKNNNQGTNDDINTGTDNTFQAVEPAKSGEQQQQQGSGENIAPIGAATPKSDTACEQGSNCTDQQGSSDRDRSTTDAATTNQDDNTPFVLSLPFP